MHPEDPITSLGKTLENFFGITELTELVNQIREGRGQLPLGASTIERYNRPGSGYEDGPNDQYGLDLVYIVGLMFDKIDDVKRIVI